MDENKRRYKIPKNFDSTRTGLGAKDKVQRRLLPDPRATLQLKRYSSPPGSLNTAFTADDAAGGPDLQEEDTCVPSPDIVRRCGLSRKHYYGSFEALNLVNTGGEVNENAGRFRIENGEIGQQNGMSTSKGSGVHLENPEFQTRWYFKYFLGKVHQNYVGIDGDCKNPFALSVCLTDAENYGIPQYRAILWRKTGSEKLCIPYHPNKPVSAKLVLQSFALEKIDKGPREILNPDIQKELLVLEEQEGSINFKIGVLYAKQKQTSDDEMFSNEGASEEFSAFLDVLGDKIELKGWAGYRGGLDVKHNMTGSQSLHTVYQGHEIMFHVSTLLPITPDNPQQVERKRHIGNDMVIIVFQDCDESEKPSFTPPAVKSKFIHVYALVSYKKSENSYRLTIFADKNVPIFGPPLPCPPVFRDHQQFRDFLLVKLINGEKAAYSSPTFSNRRQRTLDSLITRLLHDHMHEKLGVRKSWNEVLSDSSRGTRRKDAERDQLFLQLGQSLKLKTIVKGDAPTSLYSTSVNTKVEPWEPQSVYDNLRYKVICGDSWGDALIISTEAGIHTLCDGKLRQLFDKTVIAKQIAVVEAYGLVLLRLEKGKDFNSARICAFRLSDFEEPKEAELKTKEACKNCKIERTKGCHLFSVGQTSGTHLHMAVASSKKILLFRWKHSVVWSSWSVDSWKFVADGFDVLKEVTVAESPILMTLVQASTSELLVCAGYKNQFDLITISGDSTRIHTVDKQKKATLVSALDVYEEEEEPEILISFNHQSMFKKLHGEQSSNLTFHWNSAPCAVVCAFPYLLAFTVNTIEIRLVVNGNLVHTLVLPKVKLITSKSDIFFIASPPKASQSHHSSFAARPSSPGGSQECTSVYKISTFALMGQFLDVPSIIKIPETAALSPEELAGSSGSEKSFSKHVRRVSLENSASNRENEEAPIASSLKNRTLSFIGSDCLASTPSGTFQLDNDDEDKVPAKFTLM